VLFAQATGTGAVQQDALSFAVGVSSSKCLDIPRTQPRGPIAQHRPGIMVLDLNKKEAPNNIWSCCLALTNSRE